MAGLELISVGPPGAAREFRPAYLDRAPDKQDRRKLTVSLTDRGRAASEVQKTAREKVDAELLARVGADDVARTRRTLAALIDIGQQAEPGSEE